MSDASEVNALCAVIGWKGPTLAEKLGIAPAIAYAMKAGTKECPASDLDWLRRLAAAHEATPRVLPEPDDFDIEKVTVIAHYHPAPSPQSLETDMDPNLVLTTLLDVYDEAGEEGGAAISETLSRLNLLDQARAILRQRAAVKMGLPDSAPEREPFPQV